ncbi:MAG: hypothetical protein VXZ96_02950 [Myxococcota bacterium]|nr:hypothetical protein [Myxococcota bacterium]
MQIDPTIDVDNQIRRALLDQSHFLKNWSKTKINGELVVLGHKQDLLAVQFEPKEHRIIRYFDLRNTQFTAAHSTYLEKRESLSDWIVDALLDWQKGWDNAITTIQNDPRSAITFSSHTTLGGQHLTWVDVDFTPPIDWPEDKRFIRVSLSDRWRISSDLQSTPPILPQFLEPEDLEIIRQSEESQWGVLHELLSEQAFYALHSETEIVAWYNQRPYHIILDKEGGDLHIVQIDDWSGENRGFGVNIWPNSVLEDLANKTVYGQPREALRPYSDSLKSQIKIRLEETR